MDVRRPLQTSPLGVPDFEWPRAIATQALNLVENKKWVSIPTATLTALNPVYQLLGTFSMVAKATGRFRARMMGYIANEDSGNHNFFGGIGHSALLTTYAQSPLTVPPSGESNMATVALTVDFAVLGFTAAVGSTTTINALGGCDSASHLVIFTNAMQFEVEEY